MIAQAEGTGPATAENRGAGPVLSLEHISKTYPGTRALIDVSFDLHPGEVHCLIGENGAGKSTLMKILAGVVRPDEGVIRMTEEAHDHLTPRSALTLGVSTIYQDADIVTSLTVAENIFLGKERGGGLGIVDNSTQRRIVRDLVDDLGVHLDPDALGADLSPAERQLTMIVRALSFEPSVLVLDEPTASLGQSETEHLLALVRRLAEKGLGIIYISHYLEEIMAIGDRVTVLKDGRWSPPRRWPSPPLTGSSRSWSAATPRPSSPRRRSTSAGSGSRRTASWGQASRSRHRSRCGPARCLASGAWSEPDGPS